VITTRSFASSGTLAYGYVIAGHLRIFIGDPGVTRGMPEVA